LPSDVIPSDDCTKVKIDRRNGAVPQAIFGKVFTTHHGVDHFDVFVA
jgi:hypothetical protein